MRLKIYSRHAGRQNGIIMKKDYISPEFEEIKLLAADIVTSSDGAGGSGGSGGSSGGGINTGDGDPDGDEYGEYYPIF